MGWVALKAQSYSEAEVIFEELVKGTPEPDPLRPTTARTALEAKKFPLALARYQKLTEHFPNNEAIKLEFITTLLRAGETRTAKKYLATLAYKTQKLPFIMSY